MTDLKRDRSGLAKKLAELRRKRGFRILSARELDSALAGISVPKKADAVFEGGGVKGLALVGALDVAERLGIRWQKVAGTSAGAITACLLAAGYTAEELKPLLRDLDFKQFMDEGLIDKIPLLGKVASAIFEKGIYEGDRFEEWMAELLAAKGVETFGDLKDGNGEYRLQLIASDVTRRKMLILPRDLPDYDRDPDTFPVARAARMSMSIPYFFEPVEMDYRDPVTRVRRKAFIVDGGLLSNFPVWLFDAPSGEQPRWPTYGFKLVEPDSDEPSESGWPHDYIMSLLNTMMEAHDKSYIDLKNFKRTVGIPTMGIQTTQFDMSSNEKTLLLRSGQEAALAFFKEKWDMSAHLADRGLAG